MAALTKTQLEHAKIRITEASRAFIRAKCVQPPKTINFTNVEKFTMIATGAATLKENVDPRWHGFLVDAFNYPQTPEMVEQNKAYDAWSAQSEQTRADANAIE